MHLGRFGSLPLAPADTGKGKKWGLCIFDEAFSLQERSEFWNTS